MGILIIIQFYYFIYFSFVIYNVYLLSVKARTGVAFWLNCNCIQSFDKYSKFAYALSTIWYIFFYVFVVEWNKTYLKCLRVKLKVFISFWSFIIINSFSINNFISSHSQLNRLHFWAHKRAENSMYVCEFLYLNRFYGFI